MDSEGSGNDHRERSSGFTIGLWVAAIAVIGNACVALINGSNERQLERYRLETQLRLERERAEAARVLEMIKTNPDAAAANLEFLVNTSLVQDPATVRGVRAYLASRSPGEGISLPPLTTIGVGNTGALPGTGAGGGISSSAIGAPIGSPSRPDAATNRRP